MVFKIQTVPWHLFLPTCQGLNEFIPVKLRMEPFDNDLVDLHMFKAKHHIQFFPFRCGQEVRFFCVHENGLAHGKCIILRQDLMDLMQNVMCSR